MKKACLALAVFFLLSSSLFGAQFWASRNSMRYHYPTCPRAQEIKPSDLIKFNSAEEATGAGYGPCKICRPPSGLRVGRDRYAVMTGSFEVCGILDPTLL